MWVIILISIMIIAVMKLLEVSQVVHEAEIRQRDNILDTIEAMAETSQTESEKDTIRKVHSKIRIFF